ncbi:DNA translocase FtsK [Roseivivax sp. THAF40]|uniref:DNA translocase FtsK n=1 Tax=unclassified Roseivivax TaxID=2639302 RepID=UPI001267A362|nr:MULTISPECIES: DNA translocase FtsK [unclassified Roseivivax]QFS84478.1 DNA translocase FtsK [Roseivivax sp. THAF197b]QFT48306.1 DNA translocase FtsK [Roseivivax sp. THAF40]
MAYPTRGREPLFDSDMQAAIEKRGKELMGILLVAVGLMTAAMVGSYAPSDPSWIAATDAPVQNWMGKLGAAVAAPLYMIVGRGSWAIAAVLVVWGLRMILHRGEERAMGRVIFAPIWIALLSIFAAGQVPGPDWTHSFGMGGLFGDMAMGSVLTFLPLGAGASLKLAMLVFGVFVLVFGAFVLGFTQREMAHAGRAALIGLVMAYAAFLRVLGQGANGAMRGAQAVQSAHEARRQARAEEAAQAQAFAAAQAQVPAPQARTAPRATDRVIRAEPQLTASRNPGARVVPAAGAAMPMAASQAAYADEDDLFEPDWQPEPQPERGSFLSRLMPRSEPVEPQPELVEPDLAPDADMPEDARVSAKIADAVKAKLRRVPEARVVAEAPLTKGRGRRPDPLIYTPAPTGLRAEPPLTSGMSNAAATAATGVSAAAGFAAGAATRAMPAAPQDTAAPQETAPRSMPAAPQETAAHRVLERAPVAVPPAPQDERFVAVEDDADMEMDEDGYIAPDFGDHAPEPAVSRPVVPVAQPKKVVQPAARKPVQPSKRARAEAQPSLAFEDGADDFELPPLSLLANPDGIERHHLSDEALEENARMLEVVLDDYGVKGEIVSVRPGPVVTMYELEPAPGLKASRVIGLADDIARSMSALSARVSTVPGRSVIGIELPNDKREMVSFREILSSRSYGDGTQRLPLALGKDIGGDPMVANLAKMPHLLIAGTTGSGKSVAINTMILSLLYKLTPEDLRLVMIDPKMLELSVYDGIPHLLSPVVTDPKKAVVALKWVVGEMEDRYRKMSKMGVRNIDGYNGRVEDALGKGEMFSRTVQTGFDDETGEPVFETEEFEPKKMPYIVVIVDEMADLMMVAGKEIEACIQRLAQMARASGIHLIMATQRPSVDVITGTIKANFPTRISFQVTSKIDSRTILGEMGAEQLLGQGDMLYMAGGAKITRCHGPFVSDEEVEEVVNHLKAFGPPSYVGGVVEGPAEEKAENIDAVLGLNTGGNTGNEDAQYDEAVEIVARDRKCSTSYIQRKLGIGYNKAARLVEQMEENGVVSAANHVGKREILIPEPV